MQHSHSACYGAAAEEYERSGLVCNRKVFKDQGHAEEFRVQGKEETAWRASLCRRRIRRGGKRLPPSTRRKRTHAEWITPLEWQPPISKSGSKNIYKAPSGFFPYFNPGSSWRSADRSMPCLFLIHTLGDTPDGRWAQQRFHHQQGNCSSFP